MSKRTPNFKLTPAEQVAREEAQEQVQAAFIALINAKGKLAEYEFKENFGFSHELPFRFKNSKTVYKATLHIDGETAETRWYRERLNTDGTESGKALPISEFDYLAVKPV